MTVIVNLDLVIPAVISNEFINIKSLQSYRENRNAYISSMTISVNQIMNYAMRMRAWDLGRVVVNFDRNDAIRYLESNPDLFEPIDHDSVYSLKIPDSEHDIEASVGQLIETLTSRINYPPKVLRTVGLL